MQIAITEDDLLDAKCQNVFSCVLAKAINRTVKQKGNFIARVNTYSFSIMRDLSGPIYTRQHSESALDIIRRFDAGGLDDCIKAGETFEINLEDFYDDLESE